MKVFKLNIAAGYKRYSGVLYYMAFSTAKTNKHNGLNPSK